MEYFKPNKVQLQIIKLCNKPQRSAVLIKRLGITENSLMYHLRKLQDNNYLEKIENPLAKHGGQGTTYQHTGRRYEYEPPSIKYNTGFTWLGVRF